MPYKNPDDKRRWSAEENRRRRLTGYYRDWKRDNEVGGVRVNGKRKYTGFCEVCGRVLEDKKGQFAYHHWDNEFRECGIYLCCTCHAMAEGVDKGLSEVYIRLKALILLDRLGITMEDFDDKE